MRETRRTPTALRARSSAWLRAASAGHPSFDVTSSRTPQPATYNGLRNLIAIAIENGMNHALDVAADHGLLSSTNKSNGKTTALRRQCLGTQATSQTHRQSSKRQIPTKAPQELTFFLGSCLTDTNNVEFTDSGRETRHAFRKSNYLMQ